ncbi:antigen 5 like allergen Cul n 1-like [Aedes albopictus]|uniref:SCP domain-containing protein n=1 Tax=Aedes albopictus TaxID=7160 RepID=A0ABM1XWP7_AEDAL|nr:venom allergen 5-like [Aedes albopictus]
MKAITSVLSISAFMAISQAQANNYCYPSLCSSGDSHIACNGLTTLSSNCGADASEVTMCSTKQQLIVDLHNKIRSKVAMGQQYNGANQRFSQAARMATMQWDPELAYIAATNARRCVFGHDRCHNTATMKYVGQNIAIKSYYGMTFSNEELLTGFINNWFSEYKVTMPHHIASYPATYRGPTIGHFTQMVSDETSRIGCAMVSYKRGNYINKLFVCNYGLTNIINHPVYVAGNVCSRCNSGCNSQYPGLCSTSEIVRNNI